MNFLNRRLLLTLTACSAMSCGSRGSSGQSKRTEIHLTVHSQIAQYLPAFVAGAAGCFKRQNLAVRIEETKGQAKSVTALLAGTVDIAAWEGPMRSILCRT
jgi:ABC-type nitrate/sulfonate/bicarbonate transport system substrate-binding protein